jgi:hypothetical protein
MKQWGKEPGFPEIHECAETACFKLISTPWGAGPMRAEQGSKTT